MLSFASDYIAGAHPEVLKKLSETNLESRVGEVRIVIWFYTVSREDFIRLMK